MRGPAFLQRSRTTHEGIGAPCQARGDGEEAGGRTGRDIKPVHREVAMLTATGLIGRRAASEAAAGWDRAVTTLDLAA